MTQVSFNLDDDIEDYFPLAPPDDNSPPQSPSHESGWNNVYELLAARSYVPDAEILNELCRMSDLPAPIYEVCEGENGYYFCKVTIGGILVFQDTPSYSNIVARNNAAEMVLEFLSKCPSAFYRVDYEESTPIDER